jgi:hypothetical protein
MVESHPGYAKIAYLRYSSRTYRHGAARQGGTMTRCSMTASFLCHRHLWRTGSTSFYSDDKPRSMLQTDWLGLRTRSICSRCLQAVLAAVRGQQQWAATARRRHQRRAVDVHRRTSCRRCQLSQHVPSNDFGVKPERGRPPPKRIAED